MAVTIKLKNASGSDPSASDLVVGEVAIRTDTGKLFTKKDDNSVAEISGGGIDDGDKGDITVSNSGATFTIDNDAVTYAKIQNVSATNRILGRDSSGAGVIEEITPANLRTMLNVADGATNVTNTNQLTNGAGFITATLTNEQVQDIVGAMVSSNTESGITVTYQDGDGTLDFSVASQTDENFTTTLKNKLDGIASGATNVTNNNQLTNGAGYITATLTNEQVQDIVGGMVTGNTETGITVTYQDGDGTLDFVVGTLNQDTTGNAATATKLATARTIAGVSFDGSANISLNNNAITNGAGYITGSSLNASNLSSGTIPDARFPATLPAVSGANLTNISATVLSDSNSNTVGGTNAGDSITSGDNNTFFGKDAGTDITDAQFNTFIGSLAGSNTNSGTYLNTFVGYNAGVNNGNGHQNVFIGANTGINNANWSNVFIGNDSGDANTSGTENAFLGRGSGGANTSGSDNTCLGFGAGDNITTGSNNICIGSGSDASAADVSNEITLGDGNITKFRIPALLFQISADGINIGANDSSNPFDFLRFGASLFGAADIAPHNAGSHTVGLSFRTDSTADTTINPTEAMRISANGNIGAPNGSNIYNASDSRFKQNVTTLDKGLSAINSLRPVSFNWVEGFCDEEKDTLYGFIAQEVQTIDSNLISQFAPNRTITIGETTIENALTVNEKFIIPMLVKAVQELTARIVALES